MYPESLWQPLNSGLTCAATATSSGSNAQPTSEENVQFAINQPLIRSKQAYNKRVDIGILYRQVHLMCYVLRIDSDSDVAHH